MHPKWGKKDVVANQKRKAKVSKTSEKIPSPSGSESDSENLLIDEKEKDRFSDAEKQRTEEKRKSNLGEFSGKIPDSEGTQVGTKTSQEQSEQINTELSEKTMHEKDQIEQGRDRVREGHSRSRSRSKSKGRKSRDRSDVSPIPSREGKAHKRKRSKRRSNRSFSRSPTPQSKVRPHERHRLKGVGRRVEMTGDGVEVSVDCDDEFLQDHTSSDSSSSESESDSSSSSDSSSDGEYAYRRGRQPKRRKKEKHEKYRRRSRSRSRPRKGGRGSSRKRNSSEKLARVLYSLSKKDPKMRKLVDQISDSETEGTTGKKGRLHKSRKRKMMKRSKQVNILKSSSDTTVYALAVKQKGQVKVNRDGKTGTEEAVARVLSLLRLKDNSPSKSNFTDESNNDHSESEASGREADGPQNREEHVRQVAEDLIIAAERNKAAVTAPPKGIVPDSKSNDVDDDDDEFFNLTCHVDEKIRVLISEGKYVDLETLIPKNIWHKDQDEPRMDLVSHESGVRASFWIPQTHEKDKKITNVRKWDQAFRVYAAIYCKSNPHRASEIWQYVNLINSAAASFVWDNVAHYDYKFRKLMSSKPARSWARTHTQLYTTIMHEHLGKGGVSQSQGSSKKDWRELCCWRFNRGKCNKSASACKFEHRCTGCGMYNHGYHNCNKRRNRGEQSRGSEARSARQESRSDKKDRKRKREVEEKTENSDP